MKNQAYSKYVSQSEEEVDELASESLENLELESLSKVDHEPELELEPVLVLELLSAVV